MLIYLINQNSPNLTSNLPNKLIAYIQRYTLRYPRHTTQIVRTKDSNATHAPIVPSDPPHPPHFLRVPVRSHWRCVFHCCEQLASRQQPSRSANFGVTGRNGKSTWKCAARRSVQLGWLQRSLLDERSQRRRSVGCVLLRQCQSSNYTKMHDW